MDSNALYYRRLARCSPAGALGVSLSVLLLALACGALDDRTFEADQGGAGGGAVGEQIAAAGSGGNGTAGTAGAELGGSEPAETADGVSGAASNPCEGLPASQCECSVGESTTCGAEYASIGACGTRVLLCQEPGVWPPGTNCTPDGPELCDPGAIDDDCDGVVDEDCACINTTSESCGIGTGGLRVCADGQWGACQCEAEADLDVDGNGVADASESLVGNGRFTADLAGWLQSQRNNTEVDGVLYEHSAVDAIGASCSGSMLLISTENSGSNFADQCLTESSPSYSAAAQALLIANGGGRSTGVLTTGSDPSFAELSLTAFGSADCSGAPLGEQLERVELTPNGGWQVLRVSLPAPVGTQGLRVRINTVADDEGGLLPYQLRSVRWDNVLVRGS